MNEQRLECLLKHMGITESNVDNAVFSVQDEIFRLMSEVIAR